MRWDIKFKALGGNFVPIELSTLTANPTVYMQALWRAGGRLYFVVLTNGRWSTYKASEIRDLNELNKALNFRGWTSDPIGFYQVYNL